MRSTSHVRVAATLIAVLLGSALVAAAARAQQPAPGLAPGAMPDSASEAAALQRISEELDARRAELERERRRLWEERVRLSAIDQPASAEQIAEWSERNAAGTRIRVRIEMLKSLIAALSPQALETIPPPTGRKYEFEVSDVGLAVTSADVNLRKTPGGAPTTVLPVGTLVVPVVDDLVGKWSVVVAADGTGFVPTSLLKRAP